MQQQKEPQNRESKNQKTQQSGTAGNTGETENPSHNQQFRATLRN